VGKRDYTRGLAYRAEGKCRSCGLKGAIAESQANPPSQRGEWGRLGWSGCSYPAQRAAVTGRGDKPGAPGWLGGAAAARRFAGRVLGHALGPVQLARLQQFQHELGGFLLFPQRFPQQAGRISMAHLLR
jgi:hypothetical protein